MTLKIPHHIQSLKSYVPGKPLTELYREYGITNAIKLASNENPLGPSSRALEAVAVALAGLHRYPDGAAHDLTAGLAMFLGVNPDMLVLGNGSDDIIGMLTRALLCPGDEVLIPRPTFLMYEILVRSAGAKVVDVPLCDMQIDCRALLERVTPRCRMVFICNPNNPTGAVLPRTEFEFLLDHLPEHVLMVVDEAYFEFVTDVNTFSGLDYLKTGRVAVLRTFSKAYGLAGLRVGYGVMDAGLAGTLHRVRQPFNVSIPAQAGALAALSDHEFLQKTRQLVHTQLQRLYQGLRHLQIPFFETQANFFLIDVAQPSGIVFERLLYEGVIVRAMHGYGFPYYIRISVGRPEENQRFLKALAKVLSGRRFCGTPSQSGRPDPFLIVIDGPAGAGKTTVSQRLAACLGYRFLDTGALYRAVARQALIQQINLDDDAALGGLLTNMRMDVTVEGQAQIIRVDGADITAELRSPAVAMAASKVSAQPAVRRALLKLQHQLAEGKGLVAEGRDLGTVVFPDAEVKFFLEADATVRARRRFQETPVAASMSLTEVVADLNQRDHDDSRRELAPLKPARDAVIVDSTHLNVAEVVQHMLTKIYRCRDELYTGAPASL